GTTDDTAAIQAAIDADPNGSATIVIPTGKFRITSPVVVPVTASNLTIEGNQDGVIYADIPAKGGIESRTAIRLESYFPDWGTGINHHMYWDEFPKPVALNLASPGAASFTCSTSCGTLRVGDWVALAEGNDAKHDFFRNYTRVIR